MPGKGRLYFDYERHYSYGYRFRVGDTELATADCKCGRISVDGSFRPQDIHWNDSDTYDYMEIRLDNPGLTAHVVENLDPDTYYFAATAFNSLGVESAFSGEVARTVN
jgi:hypothetical protein